MVNPVEYGGSLMRNRRTFSGVAFAILLAISIFGIYSYFVTLPWSAKNAPSDPQVNEDLNQAKTLQKVGKLEEAFTIYERHAAAGYPVSMFYAAKFYSRGWGVRPDLDRARGYYLQAVEYSFSYRGETAYELGRLFQRSKGPDCNTVAIEWFKNALKWNYPKAALQLAIHYEKGLGVEPDIDQAIYYYEMAMAIQNEQAMIKYARLLMTGKQGAEVDPVKAEFLASQAAILLERKAQLGSGSAAKQLGRLYLDGELLAYDAAKARKWLLRSAKLGSTGGMHDLAQMMLEDANYPEQEEEALLWLRTAAARGHGGSMTALGRFHLAEKYGLKKQEAVLWFQRGAEVPHGGSLEELARLYDEGVLIPRDREEAISLAERGMRLGHSGSVKLLKELLATKNSSAAQAQFSVKDRS